MSRRQNQWFVPGDGIAREVITADIQRYLGPDALVKPGNGTGENEGVAGYWITAYRTLTTQMIQDLKLDSQRWRAEAGRVAYKDSRTHESRQYYGPSQTTTTPVEYPQSHDPPRQSYQAPPSSHYSVSDNYTHAPQPQSTYQSVPSGYPSQYHPPRTTPTTSYGGYSQEPPRQTTYQSPEVQYNYYPQQSSEPPRQPPVYSPAPSTGGARPGYYIASDGHEYPLSAQPQTQQPAPNSGRRRG